MKQPAAPLWKTFSIDKGQQISFLQPITGAIAYVILKVFFQWSATDIPQQRRYRQ